MYQSSPSYGDALEKNLKIHLFRLKVFQGSHWKFTFRMGKRLESEEKIDGK